MSKFVDRPRYSCALGGVLSTLRAIPRAIPIIHAASGCGYNLHNATNSGSAYLGGGYCGATSLPSTNVTERDIVFGGEKRLKEQIESTLEIEERLKAGIAFGGTCANLKDCLNKACLNNANRSFSQTYGCQHGLSLGILNTLWLSTNLDESDVISGGEKKLRDTIIYADKEFRPEVIIAVSGCVPALIGDDIDGIISDLQSEVAAALIPVTCEGFKTKVMATAYDAAYNGIMKKLLKDVIREENLVEDDFEEIKRKYLLTRHVNIFNVGSMSRADELELERLLNAIGLTVTFLPCYSAPKDFAYSLENSLNVSICGTHDDYYIKYVEQEYGIPFIIDTIPIGRKNTARWVLKIVEHFNLEKEAEAFLKKEDELLNESLKPYRKKLKGKRMHLGGGAIRIVATAEVLQDLGMEIVGFKGHHIDKFIEPTFEALENIDDVVFNVATQQPFEQVNVVNKLKPDVIVIHSGINNITAKQGLPILPLFGPTNIYMGYTGVFEIACRLSRKIKNNQFNKNISKNRSLPYKKEWYDKEPFTYIKED